MQVTLAPADYESWSVARSETMVRALQKPKKRGAGVSLSLVRACVQAEAKAGLKAKLEAEMAAAADDSELKALRDRFSREERELEHKIDHEVHTFSATLDMQYNVRHAFIEPYPFNVPHLTCGLFFWLAQFLDK